MGIELESLLEKHIDIDQIRELANKENFTLELKFKNNELHAYLHNPDRNEYCTTIPLKELGNVSVKVFLESMVEVYDDEAE